MLPNMARTIDKFKQSIKIKRQTGTSIVNFVEVVTFAEVDTFGVVQVASSETIKNLGLDYSIRYLQVHVSLLDMVSDLVIEDMIIYQTKEYRIVDIRDYSDYGYFELVCEEIKNA